MVSNVPASRLVVGDLNTSADSDVFETDRDLLDEIRRLDDEDQGGMGADKQQGENQGQTKVTDSKSARTAVVKEVSALSERLTLEKLSELPSLHLVEIHQHLNCIMGNVVMALKSKCPSPTSSQSSQ